VGRGAAAVGRVRAAGAAAVGRICAAGAAVGRGREAGAAVRRHGGDAACPWEAVRVHARHAVRLLHVACSKPQALPCINALSRANNLITSGRPTALQMNQRTHLGWPSPRGCSWPRPRRLRPVRRARSSQGSPPSSPPSLLLLLRLVLDWSAGGGAVEWRARVNRSRARGNK
jgi:hypothetical protein